MPNSLEIHGHFWLPGQDDKLISGILTFSAEEGGCLTLIGRLEADEEIFQGTSKDYSRILGADEKHLYTLDGCLRTFSTLTFRGIRGRQTFRVGRIIKGYAYEKDQAVEVDGLDVWLANLTDWVKIDGITETGFSEGPRGPITKWEITAEWQLSLTGSFADGTVHVKHQVIQSDLGVHGVTLTQKNHAKFEFGAELDLEDAIDYASGLQDLISIATGRTAAFESVQLYHPKLALERSDGSLIPQPADLFQEWIARARPTKKG